MDLINAAKTYADSQVVYPEGDVNDPEYVPNRSNDTSTDLEMAIGRATLAIRAMMETAAGRKAAGMKPRGRGRTYTPERTKLSDPQVQVVLKMLRGEKKADVAYSEISRILDPTEQIDPRTVSEYVSELISMWSGYADKNYRPFWVHNDEN